MIVTPNLLELEIIGLSSSDLTDRKEDRVMLVQTYNYWKDLTTVLKNAKTGPHSCNVLVLELPENELWASEVIAYINSTGYGPISLTAQVLLNVQHPLLAKSHPNFFFIEDQGTDICGAMWREGKPGEVVRRFSHRYGRGCFVPVIAV